MRVVDAFADHLDLVAPGFERADPAFTGRASHHPSVLLRIYIYGHPNRIASSRRLEREAKEDECAGTDHGAHVRNNQLRG